MTLQRFPGPGGVERARLSLGRAKVEVHREHLDKLRVLHRRAKAMREGQSPPDGDEGVTGTERRSFFGDAFAVLCRYASARGGMHRVAGGHHTALHGEVFDALRDALRRGGGMLRLPAELPVGPLLQRPRRR